MATVGKCVAPQSPAVYPSGPPHAARTTHAFGEDAAIKSTRLLRTPFHFVHTEPLRGCCNAIAKC